MVDLDTIGKGCVLTKEAAEWLRIVAQDYLYREGWYAKGIYLDKFIENATIIDDEEKK